MSIVYDSIKITPQISTFEQTLKSCTEIAASYKVGIFFFVNFWLNKQPCILFFCDFKVHGCSDERPSLLFIQHSCKKQLLQRLHLVRFFFKIFKTQSFLRFWLFPRRLDKFSEHLQTIEDLEHHPDFNQIIKNLAVDRIYGSQAQTLVDSKLLTNLVLQSFEKKASLMQSVKFVKWSLFFVV